MKIIFSLFAILFVPMISFAQLTAVDYKDGEQALSGFGIKPKSELKDKPGVLVLPAWFGIDAHTKESAEKLAELGYYSFVADIYGKDNRPKNSGEAGKKCGLLQEKCS